MVRGKAHRNVVNTYMIAFAEHNRLHPLVVQAVCL